MEESERPKVIAPKSRGGRKNLQISVVFLVRNTGKYSMFCEQRGWANRLFRLLDYFALRYTSFVVSHYAQLRTYARHAIS